MAEFKEIKAKVCPNLECKQIIPEEWNACYNDEWCPNCGYGLPKENYKSAQ